MTNNVSANSVNTKSNAKYRSIPITTIFYLAWRNLNFKRLRSALTISGVAIGIGAVYFLLSFGLGLQNLVTQQVVGGQSIKAVDVSTANSKLIDLSQTNYEKMQHFGKIDKYGAVLLVPGSMKIGQTGSSSIVVYGSDKGYIKLANLDLKNGRYADSQNTSEAVVNTAALSSAGITNSKDAIGQKLHLLIPIEGNAKTKLIDKDLTVVGVVDSGSGGEAYVSYDIFSALEVGRYTQVKLVAHDRADVANLRKQVESLGFQTVSAIDTVDQIDKIFRMFNIILGAFGTIGMVVAILGMFNTLTISLIERTPEIGLMMALGGRRRDMSRLFIFEALILSMLGAIAGIALARTGTFLTNAILNQYANARGVNETFTLFTNPWWLQVAMIIFMSLVGLLVVILPARRAERISPIDAMRRE